MSSKYIFIAGLIFTGFLMGCASKNAETNPSAFFTNTPTNTATPAFALTSTPTITASETPTSTSTLTDTPKATPTITLTPTETLTFTATNSTTLTNTPTTTPTPIPTKWITALNITLGAIDSNGIIYGISYGASAGDTLVAVHPSDGSVDWRQPLGQGTRGYPVIYNDGSILIALTGNGGSLCKISPGGGASNLSGIGWVVKSYWPAVGSDGSIYFGLYQSGVLVNFGNWLYGPSENYTAEEGQSPIIDEGGNIYFGCDDGNIYAFSSNSNYPFPTSSWLNNYQTPLWTHAVGGNNGVRAEAIGGDGTIYCQDSMGSLVALNSSDGSLKWSKPLGAHTYPAVGSDGTIYTGSKDGNLYAINEDGTTKWSINLGGNLSAGSLALANDGTIYLTYANYMYSVNSFGLLNWKFYVPAIGAPLIGTDGTIYVSGGGNLYAIQGSSPLATSPWPKWQKNNLNNGRY